MSKDSTIIDGKKIARTIEEGVRSEVALLKEKKIVPTLATILVGENQSSEIYSQLIQKVCDRVGIHVECSTLPASTPEEDLLDRIRSLNYSNTTHGILVHRPLPNHIREETIMEAVSPEKDVDGLHPLHLGRTASGVEDIVPCAPQAVITVLQHYHVEIRGKNAVVVGHSSGVGKPMALLLLNRNATVNVCHIYTENLENHTKDADIVITAAGVKNLIKENMIKEGAVVLDIGGDIAFDSVKKKTSLITPPTGGIGPITVALLMDHVVRLSQRT